MDEWTMLTPEESDAAGTWYYCKRPNSKYPHCFRWESEEGDDPDMSNAELAAIPPVKGLVGAARRLLAKVNLEPGTGKPLLIPVLIGDLVLLADALAALEAE